MQSDQVVKIKELEAFRLKMEEIPKKLQLKVLKTLIRDSMKVVEAEAESFARVLDKPILRNGYPIRLPGTMKKAIAVRPSKVEAKSGNVGFFVNVKPLKGNLYKQIGTTIDKTGIKRKKYVIVRKSSRSALNPRDPYYWRFVEFGTKRSRKFEFLTPAASALSKAVEVFQERISEWVKKSNALGAVKDDA